jgi:hypothetical protein
MTLLACLQSFRWFSSFSLLGPIRLPSFFLGREAEASQHPPRFPTAHPSSCTQVSRFKKWHILHPGHFFLPCLPSLKKTPPFPHPMRHSQPLR